MIDPEDFTPEALRKIAPACSDCPDGGQVDIADGEAIYPRRRDLWKDDEGGKRWWWRCKCGAYVGTHKGTITALGKPAGEATRKARIEAHAAFDPLWRKRMALSGLTQKTARGRGYKWLAAQLGIDRKACHIGDMTAEMARRVVEVCKAGKSAASTGERDE